MGANGQHAAGLLESEGKRRWYTIGEIGKNIKILQMKQIPGRKVSIKLPEESHTPSRIYAIMEKDGSDVKSIAQYGLDGKKLLEIHTTDHRGLGVHYHKWSDCRPGEAQPLTPALKKLLKKIRDYE